jgi:hypothetical protein
VWASSTLVTFRGLTRAVALCRDRSRAAMVCRAMRAASRLFARGMEAGTAMTALVAAVPIFFWRAWFTTARPERSEGRALT